VDISSADNVVSAGAKFGLNADELRAGIGDPATKDRTKAEVDKAIAVGAFGSPYIVIDGEPFWGSDRLEQIEKWLATGGW
jgi:2-hydroxychromene-2-carboxylate isomerase